MYLRKQMSESAEVSGEFERVDAVFVRETGRTERDRRNHVVSAGVSNEKKIVSVGGGSRIVLSCELSSGLRGAILRVVRGTMHEELSRSGRK
jgi:hypothetical protein